MNRYEIDAEAAQRIAEQVDAGNWVSLWINPLGISVAVHSAPRPDDAMQRHLGSHLSATGQLSAAICKAADAAAKSSAPQRVARSKKRKA